MEQTNSSAMSFDVWLAPPAPAAAGVMGVEAAPQGADPLVPILNRLPRVQAPAPMVMMRGAVGAVGVAGAGAPCSAPAFPGPQQRR